MSSEWPWYDCPECGCNVWIDGFDDATTVRGQGDHRSVAHCGVCEFAVVSRANGPHHDSQAFEGAKMSNGPQSSFVQGAKRLFRVWRSWL